MQRLWLKQPTGTLISRGNLYKYESDDVLSLIRKIMYLSLCNRAYETLMAYDDRYKSLPEVAPSY